MKRFYFLYYLILISLIVTGVSCDAGYDRQFLDKDNNFSRYQYAFIRQ